MIDHRQPGQPISIDETKLDREIANELETELIRTLTAFGGMEDIAKEVAQHITIPIAKYLEMGGGDSDTRFDLHNMIVRAITLGFAQYFERHIKPDGMETMIGIITEWFGKALTQAIQLTQERRTLEVFLKKIQVEEEE